MRRLVTVICGLVLLAAAGAGGAWLWLQQYLDTPLGSLAEAHILEVPTGQSLVATARSLERAGLLAHPRVFAGYGRWAGLAAKIQAGEYELSAQQTPRALLGMLAAGKVKLYNFTFVEGWTTRDLLAALRAEPTIAQTLVAETPEELAAELGLDRTHAEGLFLPETYRYPRGTPDRQLLLQANELLKEKLQQVWRERAGKLPLKNAYEALILASIIERETALNSEREQIAGVFVRRLQRGMRLQTDPTVIYGLGAAFDGDLRRADLRRDTPYNSYTREGLPPTPIALAGEASLRAAVSPAEGDALYFVATGLPDGSHSFTATLADHNAAVGRYLARLRARDGGG